MDHCVTFPETKTLRKVHNEEVNDTCQESCACERSKLQDLYRYLRTHDLDTRGKKPGLKEKLDVTKRFLAHKLWVPKWMEFKTHWNKGEIIEQEDSTTFRTVQFFDSPEEDEVESEPEQDTKDELETIEEVQHSEPSKPPKTLFDPRSLRALITPAILTANLVSFEDQIPASFIPVLHFITIAIKAIRLKVERIKLGSKFSALNFSGYRGNIFNTLNDTFMATMTYSGSCSYVYLKGEEGMKLIPDVQRPYVVCCTTLSGDPDCLDICSGCGAIFSVYKINPKLSASCAKTAYVDGKFLLFAGYVLFSSDTKLVFTLARQLFSFTLDPAIMEFVMDPVQITTPQQATFVSVEEGQTGLWEPQLVEYVRRKKDPAFGKPLNSLSTGSLVADFDRILRFGGIYLYPANRKEPQGKTSLLCEGIPLANIIRLAGGTATTGKTNVANMNPDSLDQCIPFFIGTKTEIDELLTISM